MRAQRALPSDPIVEKGIDFEPLRRDCDLTLLDMYRDETPPPFYHAEALALYSGQYDLVASDDPSIRRIRLFYAANHRLDRVFFLYLYRMYLGCIVDNDWQHFETLQTLDWGVQLAGAVTEGAEAPPSDYPAHHHVYAWPDVPYLFHLDEKRSKRCMEQPVISTETPKMTTPTHNQCYGHNWGKR